MYESPHPHTLCLFTQVRICISLASLPQGPGPSGEVLTDGGSGSCRAVSRAHDNPLPSSPRGRVQLTGISPNPYREVRRGRGKGQRTGWLLPAPTGHPPSTASDNRSLETAPHHSPAASEQGLRSAGLEREAMMLSPEAGACLPLLPAQEGRGRTLTTSFMETLVASWGPQ